MRAVIAVVVASLVSAAALARDPDPVEVSVTVVDAAGKPVPTATIRHPEEETRHPVNVSDGSWSDDRLYLPDGRELLFVRDLELHLEVSAPGYVLKDFVYVVKKRKNRVTVELEPMPEIEIEDPDSIIVGPRGDVPLDGSGPVEPEEPADGG